MKKIKIHIVKGKSFDTLTRYNKIDKVMKTFVRDNISVDEVEGIKLGGKIPTKRHIAGDNYVIEVIIKKKRKNVFRKLFNLIK